MKLKFHINKIFSDKKKNITIVYIIVIIGVLFLCIGSFIPQKEAEEITNDTQINENLEKRLSNILSKINGVGDVHVMITYKSSATKATAKDRNLETNQTESRVSEENVLVANGSSRTPFVIREDMPKVMGVVVVAQGAGDVNIKRQIFDAVKALTGVTANNIGVFAK